MAGIAKAVQLVSNGNGVQDSVAVCDIISLCDSPNNVEKSEKDDGDALADISFQLPSGDEGSSLQDLIDSELALRISNKLDDETDETDGDAYGPKPEIQITPDSDTENSDFLDINTQFILSERSHCLKNMPGNGSHFFTTITDDDDVDLDDHCGDTAIYNSNELEGSPTENADISFSGLNCSTGEAVDEPPDFRNQFSCLERNEILTPPPEDFGTDKFPPQNLVNVSSERNGTETPCLSSHDSKSPTECAKLYSNSVDGDCDETDRLSGQPDRGIPNFLSDTSNVFDPLVKVDNSMVDFTACVDSNVENFEKFEVSEVNEVSFEDNLNVLSTSDNQNEVELACGDTENVCELGKNALDCVNSLELSSSSLESSSISDEANETTSNTPEKKIKKKKNEGADSVKIKKTKKNKKSESEKENISVRSSFSKFDQLSKKTVLHVRSVDAAKVQQQFNQSASVSPEQANNCRSCEKQVFQMEQIKAERSVWHKNCFRCKECNKQLTVDTYSSHEGQLYCKPHFKELFKPKAVLDEDSDMPILRKPKMIICENEPVELPPDVVRASSKPDLGLEELTSLNVKSRFQVFEKTEDSTNDIERSASSVSVKRSPSILSKLARFQAKGMDIGVTDDSLNGIPYEESSSSSEEEEDSVKEGEADLVKSCRKQRERPMSFNKMDDIKCKWETGQAARKEERREERKQEIQSIRSRLFLGKQGKMKEMYEQAVIDSERGAQKKGVDIGSDRARTIKEKFERGEVLADDEDIVNKEEQARKAKEEELSLFEAGISKKSRSLFMELDASAAKNQQQPLLSPVKSPSPRDDTRKSREAFVTQTSKDIVRASDAVDDVKIETSEVSNKFKFFETYKEAEKPKSQFRITPPREGQVKEKSPDNIIYRDPNVVRSDDKIEEEVIRSKTTSKMLSLFRQLEENANKEEVPEGPKPLKCFTPPPDYTRETDSSESESQSEDEDNEEYDDPNIIRSSDKIDDEILREARNAARAKILRAKFERWEEKENKLNGENGGGNLEKPENEQSEQASIDSTKSLLAKFESMKNEGNQPKERVRPRVNRFV